MLQTHLITVKKEDLPIKISKMTQQFNMNEVTVKDFQLSVDVNNNLLAIVYYDDGK